MEHTFPPRSPQVSNRTATVVMEFEPLLDSIQAANLLRMHPKTLQKMARSGEIRATHVGKYWRFRVSELNDWISHQKRVG